MKIYGIDVSRWQGDIDWKRVEAAKVGFAILKCGGSDDGLYKDRDFEQNYVRAKSAGVPVGAYWFTNAMSEADAVRDAEFCISILDGKQFEYPIWFDIERQNIFSLGIGRCSAICRAFCSKLEDAGYFVGIYSSKSHLMSYLSAEIRERYAIWVAQYYSECTYPAQHTMWQYSDSGKIDGISGNVDLDVSYVDYATLIKNMGLNGFKTPDAETVPEPTEEPQKQSDEYTDIDGLRILKRGCKGHDVQQMQALLIADGYSCGTSMADADFGPATEKAIINFQTDHKIECTGICDRKTWKELLRR